MRAVHLTIGALLVVGVSGEAGAEPGAAPLQMVMSSAGCPMEVKLDKSCDSGPHAGQGVCRDRNEPVSWEAVDQNGKPLDADFSLRFKSKERILVKEKTTRVNCDDSNHGVMHCEIKAQAPSGAYRYVVQVEDTNCPVINPWIYVN
jgi:hypothetical protein